MTVQSLSSGRKTNYHCGFWFDPAIDFFRVLVPYQERFVQWEVHTQTRLVTHTGQTDCTTRSLFPPQVMTHAARLGTHVLKKVSVCWRLVVGDDRIQKQQSRPHSEDLTPILTLNRLSTTATLRATLHRVYASSLRAPLYRVHQLVISTTFHIPAARSK